MVKPLLRPNRNSYRDIIKAFNDGKPLSAEQLRLLRQHFANLPKSLRDILWQRDDDANKKLDLLKRPLWLTDSLQNANSLQQLATKINLLLRYQPQGVTIRFTTAQFLQFKTAIKIHTYQPTLQDLIYWYGNQMLTGAPFIPGGVPRLDYFQWGNLYGIVKFHELIGEKVHEGNILIYFEQLQDRQAEQFVQQAYYQTYGEELRLKLQPNTPPSQTASESKLIQETPQTWQPPRPGIKLTPYGWKKEDL